MDREEPVRFKRVVDSHERHCKTVGWNVDGNGSEKQVLAGASMTKYACWSKRELVKKLEAVELTVAMQNIQIEELKAALAFLRALNTQLEDELGGKLQ